MVRYGIVYFLCLFLFSLFYFSIILHQNHNSDSRNNSTKCEVIHVGLVCAGYNSSRIVATLFKSILFHRQHPIHFHLMVDEKAELILRYLFDTWKLPEVNVTFYKAEKYIKSVEWIPNKHYSGVFGLLKLLFPQILAETVPKIITLDTDVTILANIFELWTQFGQFRKNQAIGVVENQSNWYFGKLWNSYKPWPAIGRGFNTGVMLLNIAELNRWNWTMLWRVTAAQYLGTFGSTGLADQDILNAVIKDNPKFLYRLPCQWNVQLGDNTLSGACYKDINEIKIIHWNSPRKLKVRNKDGAVLRVLYQTFLEYNGNFLRAPLFNCGYKLNNFNTVEHDFDDKCRELRQMQTTVWRTHLFITDFNYVPTMDGSDVTLITQLSFDRIQMVEEICKHWDGPASFTFYITDAELQNVLNYIQNSPNLRNRNNIAYHIVYKDGDIYPVNYLRNIGLKYVTTPYVFLTDIDFLPMYGLYISLRKHIRNISMVNNYAKKALVVAAFETQRYKISFPTSKEQLLYMLDHQIVFTFRFHVWAKGHEATNFTRWRNVLHPYKVDWQPDFEPYVVVPRTVPLYDTRFAGFGWNKVSHIMALNANGYEFIVLPDTFIIHLPHSPSYDIAKFRSSNDYRRCLKRLKNEFIDELKKQGTTPRALQTTIKV